MPEIPIKSGMTLKLNHVLCRRVGGMGDEQFMKVATMLDNYIASMKYTKYGPVIFRNTIEGDAVSTTIMTQIRDEPSSVDEPFQFREVLMEEGCIAVRFKGPERMFNLAESKGRLYAYENGLTLSGTTYVVVKEREGGNISADLFFCTVPQ